MKKNKFFLSSVLLLAGNQMFAQDIFTAANGANITIEKTANVFIGGGILLQNNSMFYNKGTVLLALTGKQKANFTDHSASPYHYGPGKFIFSGDGEQSIKTANRLGLIEVDNKGLSLFSDISSETWLLKNGKVNTEYYYAIATDAQVAGFRIEGDNDYFSKSWINGNLRQYISPETVDQYILPVGDKVSVKACALTNLSHNPLKGISYLDVSYTKPSGLNENLKISENGLRYGSISPYGMWTILPDAHPASGSFDLHVSVADFSNLQDNRFALVNRLGSRTNLNDWTVPAGSYLPAEGRDGRTIASGFARRNKVGVFNQFAIASLDDVGSGEMGSSYKVFPDPVTNREFFIQVKNYQLTGFKILTSDGKEIPVNSLLQKNGLIKVTLPATFPKGYYVVQLNTDKGFRNCNIVVL